MKIYAIEARDRHTGEFRLLVAYNGLPVAFTAPEDQPDLLVVIETVD